MAIEPIWFDSFNAAQVADDIQGDYTAVNAAPFSLSIGETDGKRNMNFSAGSGEGRGRRTVPAFGSGTHWVTGMSVRGTSSRPMHRWCDGDSSLMLVWFRDAGIELHIGGSLVETSAPVYNGGSWQFAEVEAFIDAASGWVRVYHDRQLIIEWEGDTSGLAATNSVQWNCLSTGGGGGCRWTDLYIAQVTGADEGTEGNVLGPITCPELPVDADVANAFDLSTGTDSFALLDDLPNDDDTTYVESGVVDAEDAYEVDPSSIGDEPIAAVGVCVTARQSTEGTLKLRQGLKSGATTEYTDPYVVLGSYQTRMIDLWLTDPDDAGEWTTTKLAAVNVLFQNRAS